MHAHTERDRQTHLRCNKGEVEPLWQLKVQLYGSTLVWALQGVLNDNVNLEWKQTFRAERSADLTCTGLMTAGGVWVACSVHIRTHLLCRHVHLLYMHAHTHTHTRTHTTHTHTPHTHAHHTHTHARAHAHTRTHTHTCTPLARRRPHPQGSAPTPAQTISETAQVATEQKTTQHNSQSTLKQMSHLSSPVADPLVQQ